MRKSFLLLAFSSVLVLAACGDDKKQEDSGQAGASQGAQASGAGGGALGKPSDQQKTPPQEVKYLTIEPRRIAVSDELPGRVTAYKTAEIRPQVNGIILTRSFDEGSVVKEGQQLYQIDPKPYEAALKTAQAELLRARAQLKSVKALAARYQTLIKANAISKQEYDDAIAQLAQAEADVAVAEAQVDTAQINLDYTKVYSPITGYIGTSSVTEGALVTAQQEGPLAVVRQLDPVYVDLSQSGAKAMQLRNKLAGQQMRGDITMQAPVTLMLDNLDKPYDKTGQLQVADMAIDGSTGAVMLRATFPNPDGVLLPGLYVRAFVEQAGQSDSIIVPQNAVSRSPEGDAMVWIIKADDTVEQRKIQLGAAFEGQWIVTGGLTAGERVVVVGFMKLKPGAAVKAVAVVSQQPGSSVQNVPVSANSANAAPPGSTMGAEPAPPVAEQGAAKDGEEVGGDAKDGNADGSAKDQKEEKTDSADGKSGNE